MNHQEVREFCEARGIMALAQPTQFTPKIKPDFSFRKEHVVELVGFWCMGEIAMMPRRVLRQDGADRAVPRRYPLLSP